MEEPDSSGSDQENHLRDVHHHVTSKVESDESYSDSDSDETKEPQSMLNIYKPGHVPGKYKQSIEPEAEKHSACIAEVETLVGHSDENSEATEEPTDSQKDVSAGVEIQEKTEGEEGAQLLSVEMESNFAETGIFGKSMCVIPSMLAEEQSIKEDDMTLSKPRPPVPPKPSLDIYNPAEPVVKVDSGIESPDNRPKPKPRKSKTQSGTYSDEQLLLTDELPAKKVSPMPSPRTKRKSEETELLSSTGNEPENFEKSEDESNNQRTDLMETSAITGETKGMNNDEETVSDSTVDTVDIGSAKDLVFDDSSLNISEKQKITENVSHLHKNDDTLISNTVVNNENINFQQTVALTSFEVINTEEAVGSPCDREGDNMLSEENSDNEETNRFVNDFQDTDSWKGDMVIDQNISDSEPEGEFRTPDNHSEDEGEADVFYDSKPTHSVYIKQKTDEDLKKDEIESTKMDKVATDDEESFGGDKFPKVKIFEKVQVFEDSVVVIGKGTIKEAGYDSLSSTVSSGDLTTVTSADMKIGEEKEETKSLFDKISMFESLASEKSTNGDQPNFEKSRRSFASGSSFEILSRGCSEDSVLKSDTFSANYEKNDFEVEKSAEINTDTDVPRPTEPKSNTVLESNTTREVQAVPDTKPKTPTDVNSETESEHLLDVDQQSLEQSIELHVGHQDDNEGSKGDSMQDQMPPPIAPKSERVLESMRSLAIESSTEVPPRSPTLETEGNEEHDKVCGEDVLPYKEHASPLQEEHIPARSPSKEEHTSQQHQSYDHEQFPKLNVELNAGHQDDNEGSNGDSMEDQMPPPIAPKSERVLDSMRSLATESSPNVPPRSLTLESEGNEESDKVNYETNVQGQKLESFVICGEDVLPDTEHASPSHGEHIPAKSPSEEEHISQQYESYGYQQMPQYQVPSYPNVQYEQQQQQQHQQQQQTPPVWNQQYYYQDQSGNYQYMHPYALYNPNMNPGMFYHNPSMPYYQQPYFSHQNYGNLYGQAQEREPVYSSHMPTQTDENVYEKVGKTEREEHQSTNDGGSYGQTPKRDSNYGPQTKNPSEEDEYVQIRRSTSPTPRRSSKHAENQHATKEDPHKSYTQKHKDRASYIAENTGQIKESTERNTVSPFERRSTMPCNTPQRKMAYGNQKQKEKVGGKPREDISKKPDEDFYIYFKGINPDTNRESLAYLVEATTDGEADADKVIFNYSKTCALVTVSLSKKPGIDRVKERIQKKGIDDKSPEVYLVPAPESIAVSSEEDIGDTEGLGFYFENPRSGGADTVKDPYESEDGCCFIICYGNPDVVKRVCEKKSHTWNKKSLRVSPYYECEAGVIWDCELHVVKIPGPAVIGLQPNYLELVKRGCCEELLSILKTNYCIPSFTDKGLKVECNLTPKTENVKKLTKDWESTAQSVVYTYFGKQIIERDLKSSNDVWNELVQFLNAENIRSVTDIVLALDDESFTISLTGFPDPLNNELDKLKTKQEEIRRRLSRVSKTIEIDRMRLKLLKSIGMFEELKQELDDIEVYFGDEEVTIEGQPEDVTAVRLRMHEVSIKDSSWKHDFSGDCVRFVNEKLRDKVSETIKKNGIIAEWEMNTKEVKFCILEESKCPTDDDDDYTQIDEDIYYSYSNVDDVGTNMTQILRSNIFEKKLSFDAEIDEVFVSEEWLSLSMSITEEYEEVAEVELKRSAKNILVFGLTKDARKVYDLVRKFLEENTIYEENIDCGTISIKFIKRHKMDLVSQIENNFDKMKLRLKDDSVIIRGNRNQISETKKELKKVFESIVCKDHTINRVAVKDVFRDERDRGTIDSIENQTKCIIQLPGENETVYTSYHTWYAEPHIAEDDDGYLIPRGATSAPDDSGATEKRLFKAQNGVKITLVEGEIGQQDGDVMVVTTSPNLNLSSGKACGSILKAGGKPLQDECKAKYSTEIKHGEIAVIHGGGNLKCNRVYLTALPNWTPDDNSKQILLGFMKKCLEMASKHKKHSILFCAMGTGQLRYPVETVAMVMYQSVIDFDNDNPKTTLKDVRFVLYQMDLPTIKVFKEEERIRVEGGGTRPTFELQKGAIKIEVAVENIAEQKVDGILSSTSPNMDLSRNGACQALLKAGGNTLQDECKSKYSNHLETGQVAEVSGGKLHCKSVYLTVLPSYKPDVIDNLKDTLKTCLGLAQAKGYKSLAFPALGTGFLKYPKDQVCRCMFDTVMHWGVENPGTCVKTVRFIMYAKDREVIQTFKSYIQTAKGRAPRKGRKTDHRGIKETPARQPSAMYNATKDGFHIKGIQLNVHTGDILEQRTDVIVSSVSPAFEFIGGVAHTLSKKCPGLADETKSKKPKFRKKGYVMTGSHSLPSKCIIHVSYVENTAAWKEQMIKCLEKANKKRFKTIAFPVLGTGQGTKSFSPEAISECLFDAINDFAAASRTSRTIKEVNLIVYKGQQFMYKPVMDALHRKIQVAVSGKEKSGSMKEKAKGWAKGAYNLVMGRTPGEMTKDDWQTLKRQTSSMVLKIHSDSQECINSCVKMLDAQLEQAYSKKRIEDYKDVIKSLTQEEEKELDADALANITIDKNAGIITIEGPLRTVADVHSALQSKLLKIDRHRNEARGAEEYFKLVRWHFEEITDLAIEHIEYDKMLNYKIEQAYKDNKNSLEFTDSDRVCYVIDLVNLVEYPKGKEGDTVRVLRKDILKMAKSALPQEWAPMKETENLRRVNVPNTEQKYKDIEQRFLNEVRSGQYSGRIMFDKNKVQVSKIERIQNKTLYQQYQAKKKLLTEQKTNLPANMPIERELWHGTTHDAVDSIEMHGFNRSYCGKNGIWFGAGVYFAGDASYSARGWLSGANPGTTGVKGYIFLVKVLTGEFCKGNDKMRYLPPVDPNKPTVLYDCAVDNTANPMEFVIFHDTQAYPEFIITFTA